MGWPCATVGPVRRHSVSPRNRVPVDHDHATAAPHQPPLPAQSPQDADEAQAAAAHRKRRPARGSPRMDPHGRVDVAEQLGAVGGPALDHRARPEIPHERKGVMFDEPRNVLESCAVRWQNALQRLQDPVGPGDEPLRDGL